MSAPQITSSRDVDALLLHDPERHTCLLRLYDEMLDGHVVSALDAIHRAECGEQPLISALQSSSVRALFAIITLPQVLAERRRLDALRDVYDRRAALLWAWSMDGDICS